MTLSSELEDRAARIIAAASARGVKLATAESCTGGLIAATLTHIAGSSVVVDRGFVTYSNEAKTEMLGVDAGLIAGHGAVSEPVALAMAKGALARSGAMIAVSVTGVAGPGGSEAKPVGLVHLAAACGAETIHREMRFGDIGRHLVRLRSVDVAFDLVEELLSKFDQTAVP